MPDPSQDQFSPEDTQALIHAQQQLYADGDARAAKLYSFLTKNGHAVADEQGGLHPQDWKPTGSTLAGTANWQQAIDKAATPEGYSADKGIVGNAKAVLNNLGAGATAILGEPIAHPIKTAENMLTMGASVPASGGGYYSLPNGYTPPANNQTWGQAAGQLTAMVPGMALGMAGAPEAEAGAQSALAKSSPVMEAAAGGSGGDGPGGGGGGTPMPSRGGVMGYFDGTPESSITRAVKPGKNNISWNSDIGTALPQMKAAEAVMGKPIASLDDALEAATTAKKQVWSQIDARLQAAGKMGATVDGNSIADAMMNSIDKRNALQNPALADQIKSVADTYRRPMTVAETEDFLQSNNRELNGYYAKNKVSRASAQADPAIAYKVAEGDALRDALYSKIDGLFGPGAAQIKQTYGALTNVQKELAGRQNVYARQAPINLPEQLSYLSSAGKIATGNIVGGMKDIAVQRFLSEVNDTDGQISRAFQRVPQAQPFPQPASPRLAGLLERGPIQIPGQDASGPIESTPPAFSSDTRAVRKGLLLPAESGAPPLLEYYPQMSPGEQVSALMHMLRQMPQKSLPASATPIRLPPSS